MATQFLTVYVPPGDYATGIDRYRLYVESTDAGVPDRLALICPCGCDRIVHLWLVGTEGLGPKWRLEGNNETPTVVPEIHDEFCGARYRIEKGLVRWG